MLKRIKIVTSLLLVLALFGLLQLTSGGLFFNSLKNDKENFTVLQTIRQQQSALNATWVELLQTRNTLNRAGIRWMMDQSNIGSGATVAELMQGATNTLKLTEKTGRSMSRYRAIHVRVKRLSLRSNEPMISTTARWRSLFSFLARVRLTSFLINRLKAIRTLLRSSTWPICSKTIVCTILLLRITTVPTTRRCGYWSVC
ncbi:methyl-accepting chemotaxis protein I [Salmonella enterica subsp. enterica serovar Agona str. 266757-1]|nr:methyl-accepting chemotaxis protein I [Salmonella enterica subsp. enterica serovar Agona str. 266757-1]